ncbi:MAG: aldehyde ferredoxin oxidoreductase N-terminal domain-containing protein [Desulfobacterales bacterium]
MTQTYGWAGKILWVDLSEKKISEVPTSDFEPEKYIGGIGLNSKIFLEMGAPKVNAFHPDNPLMLSTGPLTGASGPFSRATMCTIAPQSYPDELFTYSGFGGRFPAELKYAGYDGIVIVGKSDTPVYLSIQDEDVEIKDAGDLWGLDSLETQVALRKRHPGASAHVIGPAGENLSRIAIIISETSGAAGQGGYGAVMGSKNLKAIVTRGTGNFKMARPDAFMKLFHESQVTRGWAAGNNIVWGRYLITLGPNMYEMWNKHLKKPSGCYGCPYQCQGFYDMPGIGKGSQMCMDAWYGMMDRKSTRGMWQGNVLSQRLGINNYELIGMMHFLSLAVGGGVLKKEDFGLSAIPFLEKPSDPRDEDETAHLAFLSELLNGIADGTSPFSQGTGRAVETFGERAMEIYYSVFPAWGNTHHHIEGVGSALHWATDTRDPMNSCQDYMRMPACGFGNNKEIADYFGVPGGYLDGERENIYEGSERETAWVQNHQSLKNSLPICELASSPGQHFRPPDMDIRKFESRMLSAVTGLDVGVDALWTAGERIYNLRRAIMVLREDRHRDHDTISKDMFDKVRGAINMISTHMPEALDNAKWEALKDRYYELRGWSIDTGRPTRANLEALDMKDVADQLDDAGKLD